jgi:hypothetical protein
MSELQSMSTTQRSGGWAAPLERLRVPILPPEAINLNVQGRRPTGPLDGFGQLWRRTYAIRLPAAKVAPAELIRVWKEHFASFWPPGNYFYGSGQPIRAGDVAVLNLAGPAGTQLATGILVVYADEESFCFMSAQGHLFGGMITFSAHGENGTTVVQVQALMRPGDPLYETIFRLGLGAKAEDAFWEGALTNLAAHFDVHDQTVTQHAVLLDPRLHWSQAKNLWYNAAIRTALHTPVRWLRKLRR